MPMMAAIADSVMRGLRPGAALPIEESKALLRTNRLCEPSGKDNPPAPHAPPAPPLSPVPQVNCCERDEKFSRTAVYHLEPQALFDIALPWADEVSRRAARVLPRHEFPRGDCRQVGRIELWRACQAYQPATNVPFAAFAHIRIRGAVLMMARNSAWRWTAGRQDIVDEHAAPCAFAEVEARSEVERLMARLSDRQRVVVEMIHLEGQKVWAVARALRVKRSTVERIERMAMNRMRRMR